MPPERGRDGFRHIEVKVAREGVRVRARRGYYATTSRDSEGSRERALRRALDSPFDLEGIPLRVAAHVFEEKTPGQARVPPEGSYEMIVVVEDEVARRTAEVREPFVVDPAAGS